MNPLLQKLIEKNEKKFDEKFGIDGPEKNSDSVGKAGCDDCVWNIKERGEHKSFLLSSQEKLIEMIIGEVEKMKVPKPKDEEMFIGYNKAIEQIISLLQDSIKK